MSSLSLPAISDATAITLIVVTVIVLLILGGCSLRCKSSKDGYMRSDLGQQNIAFHRSPVDYAFKYGNLTNGRPDLPGTLSGIPTKTLVPSDKCKGEMMDGPDWEQGNPHYITQPRNKYHQLESTLDGKGVDLWADLRKLDKGNVWNQYSNDYPGVGKAEVYLPNDARTRTLSREVGDEYVRRGMVYSDASRAAGTYGFDVFDKSEVGGTNFDYLREDPYKADWNPDWGMRYLHKPGE